MNIIHSLRDHHRWLTSGTAALSLLAAYLMEYVHAVPPCILCQLQRMTLFVLIGLCLLQNLSIRLKWCRILSDVFIVLTILFGLMVSIRHSWIQYYPDSVAGIQCPSNLWLPMNVYPFPYSLIKIMLGGSQCAKVDMTLFGITLPVWVSILMLGLLVTQIYSIRHRHKPMP